MKTLILLLLFTPYTFANEGSSAQTYEVEEEAKTFHQWPTGDLSAQVGISLERLTLLGEEKLGIDFVRTTLVATKDWSLGANWTLGTSALGEFSEGTDAIQNVRYRINQAYKYGAGVAANIGLKTKLGLNFLRPFLGMEGQIGRLKLNLQSGGLLVDSSYSYLEARAMLGVQLVTSKSVIFGLDINAAKQFFNNSISEINLSQGALNGQSYGMRTSLGYLF